MTPLSDTTDTTKIDIYQYEEFDDLDTQDYLQEIIKGFNIKDTL